MRVCFIATISRHQPPCRRYAIYGLPFQSLHWCRGVVEYGGRGQSVQAVKLFQSPPKISFTFHFNTGLSSLMMWNLENYPTTVLNERMWHFRGSVYSDPSYVFSGTLNPQAPRDLRPWISYFVFFIAAADEVRCRNMYIVTGYVIVLYVKVRWERVLSRCCPVHQ